ncbi:MAG: HlyD family efflux transporter periplasmic adaptor subunit [Planctomycetia bacterium]|nr:HlyD family efflux transporter periplasmic adaptor subunit [Planctomycetia bacterium]
MGSKIVGRLLFLVVTAALAFVAWQEWSRRQAAGMPAGIVSGNGRIESIQVDVAAKYAGRVKSIKVREGDLVAKGDILVEMDTAELQAELAKARAHIAESEESAAEAAAEIASQESQLLFAKQQLARAEKLLASKTVTRDEFEEKEARAKVAEASVNAAQAKLRSANSSIEVATAEVRRVQTELDDAVLKSPVRGRVLYRLAEEGEVLSAGGKALTLLDLGDIYMEIFLPAQEAARVKLGGEARITLDVRPEFAARASVSFVSPEAQFTPKQVETRSERDKLMFRVKLQIPPELVLPFIERIKTGIRGVGYVRIDESVPWPESLQKPFPPPPQPADAMPAAN